MTHAVVFCYVFSPRIEVSGFIFPTDNRVRKTWVSTDRNSWVRSTRMSIWFFTELSGNPSEINKPQTSNRDLNGSSNKALQRTPLCLWINQWHFFSPKTEYRRRDVIPFLHKRTRFKQNALWCMSAQKSSEVGVGGYQRVGKKIQNTFSPY